MSLPMLLTFAVLPVLPSDLVLKCYPAVSMW